MEPWRESSFELNQKEVAPQKLLLNSEIEKDILRDRQFSPKKSKKDKSHSIEPERLKLNTNVVNDQNFKLKHCISGILSRMNSQTESSGTSELKKLKSRVDKELTIQPIKPTFRKDSSDVADNFDRFEQLINDRSEQAGLVTQLKGQSRRAISDHGSISPIIPSLPDPPETKVAKLKKSLSRSFPEVSSVKMQSTRQIVARDNVFDSLSDGEQSQENEGSLSALVIPAKSLFARSWEFVMLVAVLLSLTVSPYMMAFNDRETGFYALVEVIVDVLFICDIILSFLTEVKEDGVLLTSHSQIAAHYVKSWFPIDLLCSAPTGIISFLLDTDDFISINKVLRISRIYRMTRWFRIFRLTKLAKMNRKLLPNEKIVENLERIRLLKISLLTAIILHNASCLFIFIGRYPIFYEFSWLDTQNLRYESNSIVYINTLYFSLTTILGIGYGDITSTNALERAFNCVFMVVGATFFSFTISALSKIFYKLDEKAMLLNQKFNILSQIAREYHINTKFRFKLADSLKRTIDKGHLDKHVLINGLPHNLKSKIIFIMYKKYISKLVFLKGQTREFISFVLPILTNHQFQKGETLLNIGAFLNEAFFVVNGALSIRLAQYYDNIEIARIYRNYHFGEILMQLNEQSPYEIKAKSKVCTLLILKKKDFLSLLSSFEDAIKQIMRLSVPVLEKIEERRNVIIELHKYANSAEELQRAVKYLNYFVLDFQFDSFFLGESRKIQDLDSILRNPTDIKFFKIIKHLKMSTDPRIKLFSEYLDNKFNFPTEQNSLLDLREGGLSFKPAVKKQSLEREKNKNKTDFMHVMAEQLLDYSKKNSNIPLFGKEFKTFGGKKNPSANILGVNSDLSQQNTIDLAGLKEELSKTKVKQHKTDNALFSKSKSIFGKEANQLFKKKKKTKMSSSKSIRLFRLGHKVEEHATERSNEAKRKKRTIDAFIAKHGNTANSASFSKEALMKDISANKNDLTNGSLRNITFNNRGSLTMNKEKTVSERTQLDNFVAGEEQLKAKNSASEAVDHDLLARTDKILMMLKCLKD